MQHLRSALDLDQALQFLAETDPLMAQALAHVGPPRLRKRSGGFAGLLTTLISQQVSVAAAASIENRLLSVMGEATAEAFLALSASQLRQCGVSAQKQRYITALAQAVSSGDLNFRKLSRRSDEEIDAALRAIPGIGPWTVNIYLMFSLRRADIFAAGDLALQEGYRRLAGLVERPSGEALSQISEKWRPHRSAAALVLWRFYANIPKSRATRA